MITRQDPVLLKPQQPQVATSSIYQQVLELTGFEDDPEIREIVSATLETVVEILQVGLNGKSYPLQALVEEADAIHESINDGTGNIGREAGKN